MKKIIIILSVILPIFFISSQENNIPKVFKINWGSGLKTVEKQIMSRDIGLTQLRHFQTISGRDELTDLRTSSQIRYIANGSPFLNIPSDVIFTFYNPTGTVADLKLAKIEVYLKKRYADRTWINTKSVFKSLLTFFCENYSVTLKKNEEDIVFSRYDYEVVINGIYVTFVADIGNNRLSSDDSIYFTYENNSLKNAILKRDLEIEKEKLKISEPDKNRDPDANVKNKL